MLKIQKNKLVSIGIIILDIVTIALLLNSSLRLIKLLSIFFAIVILSFQAISDYKTKTIYVFLTYVLIIFSYSSYIIVGINYSILSLVVYSILMIIFGITKIYTLGDVKLLIAQAPCYTFFVDKENVFLSLLLHLLIASVIFAIWYSICIIKDRKKNDVKKTYPFIPAVYLSDITMLIMNI